MVRNSDLNMYFHIIISLKALNILIIIINIIFYQNFLRTVLSENTKMKGSRQMGYAGKGETPFCEAVHKKKEVKPG